MNRHLRRLPVALIDSGCLRGRLIAFGILSFFLAGPVACDSLSTEPPLSGSTSISPDTPTLSAAVVSGIYAYSPGATLEIGGTARLDIELNNAGLSGSTAVGAARSLNGVTWSSSNPAVATVTSDGVVTGRGAGQATITATWIITRVPIPVTVLNRPVQSASDVTISPKPAGISANGGSIQLSAAVLDRAGQKIDDAALSWSTLDPTLIQVDRNGRVTRSETGIGRVVVASGGMADTVTVGMTESASGPMPQAPNTPPAAPGGPVQIPSSIDGTCKSDVTEAILRWLTTVPDKSTLVFGKDACYRTEGGLVLTNRQGLVFEGNGATFKVTTRGTGQRSNWIIRGGSDLTFRNMIVRGANPRAGLSEAAYVRNLEWQHGFRLRGVQGAIIENVQVYDVYGDFVNLSHDDRGAFPGQPNRDIVVRNSRFERNGRYGISVTHAEKFSFENNYIGDVRWSSFNIELNDKRELGRDIRIERNRFGPHSHHIFVSKGAGLSGRVENLTLRGNVMETDSPTCLPPIAIAAPQGWTNSDGSPVYWSGMLIEGNVLRPQTGGWAVEAARMRNVVIRRNEIASHTQAGCSQSHAVHLVDSHDVEVTGNKLTTVYLLHGRFWKTAYRADPLSSQITASGNTVN